MSIPLFTIGATAGVAGSGFTLTLGHVLGAASMLSSAAGATQQGYATQQATNYQARVHEQQATREREIGELKASRVAQDTARIAASQRALLAGQGRSLSSGAALLVQEDLEEAGKVTQMLARDEGEVKSRSLREQAVLERMKGKHAVTAGYYRGGTTLLKMGSEFT